MRALAAWWVFSSWPAASLPVASLSPAVSDAESPAVYEIVTATATELLPDAIRPFFERRLADVMTAATAGTGSDEGSPLGTSEWHYLTLDVAAGEADPVERLAAAHRFPHDRREATRLCHRHGFTAGGALPWVLEEHRGLLVVSFQEGDAEGVIREAGVLVHLATDASLPFNTTTDRDGESSGLMRWPVDIPAPGARLHRTVRHRCQYQVVERFRERFEHEVRVWPGRFRYVADPVEAAFTALLEAHEVLGALVDIDRQVSAELGLVDATTFLANLTDYYAAVADRAGSILESRLEAGALLGAGLIASAWTAAGSPLPRTLAGKVTSSPTDAPSGRTAGEGLVGARGSAVFHRAGCPHAARINPQRLVHFSGVEEARKAGRRPCKTCKPDSPP